MLFANNALSSKAKSMYGRRLQENDYQELLRKRTVSEIAAYLKNETDYKGVLKDVHEKTIHRGQLEALLKRDSFIRRQKLLRYADVRHDKYYQYSICLEEIEQILNCIRSVLADDMNAFVSELPLFMGAYMSFDLAKLMGVKTIEDLKKVIKDTMYYDALQDCLSSQPIDYAKCEMALKRYFYENQKNVIGRKFHGKLKKEIQQIFDTQTELENICKIYRMKEYFHADKESIQENLIDVRQRLNKQELEQLLDAKSGEEVLKRLEASPYKMYTDNNEFVYIEYYCTKIRYHLGKRYMHFSNSAPLVYLTYFILDNIEVENIINIIEGIRYGVAPEKIESLLIY